MLISKTDATQRYGVSRRTIHRRLANGSLTRHLADDGTTVLLDTRELDTLYAPTGPGTDPAAHGADSEPSTRAVARSATQVAEPVAAQWRPVPTPDELEAGLARALRERRLFPRLW